MRLSRPAAPATRLTEPIIDAGAAAASRKIIFMRNPFRKALSIIRDFKKEFLILNAAFFSLFLLTMTLTLLLPDIQPAVTQIVSRLVRADLGAEIYLSGNILLAAAATLLVNLIVAVLVIGLPSFIVPFFGVAFALVFAATYGITLAPIGPHAAAMIPHAVTMVIEFEAYIIAALGAYILGRTVFFPQAGEMRSFAQRYLDGARKIASLYVLVVTLLVVGAVYEAFEIIFLLRYFI